MLCTLIFGYICCMFLGSESVHNAPPLTTGTFRERENQLPLVELYIYQHYARAGHMPRNSRSTQNRFRVDRGMVFLSLSLLVFLSVCLSCLFVWLFVLNFIFVFFDMIKNIKLDE